jgi:hypothetical protein
VRAFVCVTAGTILFLFIFFYLFFCVRWLWLALVAFQIEIRNWHRISSSLSAQKRLAHPLTMFETPSATNDIAPPTAVNSWPGLAGLQGEAACCAMIPWYAANPTSNFVSMLSASGIIRPEANTNVALGIKPRSKTILFL